MKNYTVIRVHKNEFGQACKVLDTFPDYTTAYFFISKMNKMYQTASLHFVIDAYQSLRALFLIQKKENIYSDASCLIWKNLTHLTISSKFCITKIL